MEMAAAFLAGNGAAATNAPGGSDARWRDLADAAAEPNPFFHPTLLRPALDHLDPESTVRIIEAAGADGRLIGLLPVVRRTRHSRYPIRNSATWMHRQCFYGAPLLREGAEAAAWSAILDRLDHDRDAGNFLHVEGLAADGPAAAALIAACAAQGRGITAIASHKRAMLRSQLSADDYWQTHVRAKKRKEIRRLLNRLEELGAVTHRRFAPGDAPASWARDFLALECAGWKGEEGTALGNDPATCAYFERALANASAAGMLDMLRIDVDGAAIAMLVNFRMGTGAFSYKIAFDERFARFSPGVLIEIDNLRAALADPKLGWMDSCAAPDHPMIDRIWAERRKIVQYRVALAGMRRHATFAVTGWAEAAVRALRKGGQ